MRRECGLIGLAVAPHRTSSGNAFTAAVQVVADVEGEGGERCSWSCNVGGGRASSRASE